MSPSVLIILAASLAYGDRGNDTLEPAVQVGVLREVNPMGWYADLRSAEARLPVLVDDLRRARREAAPSQATDDRVAELRLARAELAVAINRHTMLSEEHQRVRAFAEDVETALPRAVAHTDDVVERVGDRCAVRGFYAFPDRMDRVLSLLRGDLVADADAPLFEVGELDTHIRGACGDEGGGDQALFNRFSAAVYAEYGLRLEAARLDVARRQEAELGWAAQQARAEVDGLHNAIASLEEHQRALEAEQPKDASADARLTALGATYALLEADMQWLPTHVTSQEWCQVLAHGGLVRAMRDPEAARPLLVDAAAAWQGSCRPVIAADLDLPELQSAWAGALFEASTLQATHLVFELGEGTWWIDGVKVVGLGRETVALVPGLHRIEHLTPGGERQHLVEHLEAGWLAIEATRSTIEAWPVDTRAQQDSVIVSWREDTFDPADQPAPRTTLDDLSRARVTLSATALRIDGRDHGGLSAEAQVRLWRGPSERLALWGGAAHDQLMGANEYRYTDSLVSRALMRERVGLTAAFASGDVQFELGPSIGFVPPDIGFAWQVDGLVRLSASRRLSVFAGAGLGAVLSPSLSHQPEPVTRLGVTFAL